MDRRVERHKKPKWQLHYKGRPLGETYTSKRKVIAAYIRLYPCLIGLGWRRVE